MGYDTDFTGVLKFTSELRASELAHLQMVLGIDIRDRANRDLGFTLDGNDSYFVKLELTDDFSGIQWTGEGKTYGMAAQVNAVIDWMRRIKPDFGLEGELEAQGDDVDDHWFLRIKDGRAVEEKAVLVGAVYRCPNCGHSVNTGTAEKIE